MTLQVNDPLREQGAEEGGHPQRSLYEMEIVGIRQLLKDALTTQQKALADGESYAYSMGVLKGSIEVLIMELDAEIAAHARYLEEQEGDRVIDFPASPIRYSA